MALATNPSFHKDLLETVKSWPPGIYSTSPVISAIEPQLSTSSMTDPLKEVSKFACPSATFYISFTNIDYFATLACKALAELYVIDGQHDKAFSLYADVSGSNHYRYCAMCICFTNDAVDCILW